MDVYKYLLEANNKYGSDKIQICKSNFKCNPEQIREKVIVAPTWEVDMFLPYVNNITHISGGLKKHERIINELDVNGKKVTHILSGIGAGSVFDVVLTLGCTSCKEVLFMGSSGALDPNINIGDIIIPKYSICGVGVDRYLTNKLIKDNECFGNIFYPNSEFFDEICNITDDIIKETDIKKYIGKNYSTDTIFAQFAHLDEIINMGCNSIEMETATFFDVANIVNIKAAAIFNVSDNTIAKKSLYSGRTDEDQNRRLNSKNKVMPIIALKALKLI